MHNCLVLHIASSSIQIASPNLLANHKSWKAAITHRAGTTNNFPSSAVLYIFRCFLTIDERFYMWEETGAPRKLIRARGQHSIQYKYLSVLCITPFFWQAKV